MISEQRFKELFQKKYENGEEKIRFSKSKSHKTEFLVTLNYINKYINNNTKVLDIGAGAGAYEAELYNKCNSIDALDLCDTNVEIMKNTFKNIKNINIYKRNIFNLSGFRNNFYDLVLVMGPMYHIQTKEDRIRALAEAIRVAKKDAPIFIAFCLQDAPLIKYVFRTENPKAGLDDIKYDRKTATILENSGSPFVLDTIDSVDGLMNEVCFKYNLEKGPLFAQDGLSQVIYDNIDGMSDEAYDEWMQYLLATAERKDLMGYSAHIVQVLFKKNYSF